MIDLPDDIWLWIDENHKADPNRLRLAHHGDSLRMFAIDQIDARQRVSAKLHETLAKIPRFVFDSTLAAQQSTSDDLASFHASLIESGSKVLDMTGGLGIDAMHISDRAESVTMIEINPEREKCAHHNALLGGYDNIRSICGNSVDLLESFQDNSFDFIFIDPARRGNHGQRLFALADCTPDVTSLMPQMLRVAPNIIIKASPMLDITQITRELSNITKIISLGTPHECKEILIICSRNHAGAPTIYSATVTDQRVITFKINNPIETSTSLFKDPISGTYLYDPYPSFAKLNVYSGLPEGIYKIDRNSNLFSSQSLIEDFPGRALRIIDVRPFNKQTIRHFSSEISNADITVRNFPLSPDELYKKLKIKPGGSHRLFATTTSENKKILILCDSVSTLS